MKSKYPKPQGGQIVCMCHCTPQDIQRPRLVKWSQYQKKTQQANQIIMIVVNGVFYEKKIAVPQKE